MTEDPSSDLPPSYFKLILSSADVIIPKDVEHDTEPLVENSFEEKNVRIIFIQKVLSIFLMQALAVALLFESYLYCGWFICSGWMFLGFLVLSAVLYLVSLILMVYCDQARNKTPYNYIILVFQPLAAPIILVLLMTLFLGDHIVQMISCAWKANVLSCFGILLYCVFLLDSKRQFKLRNCIVIATGVFVINYVCALPFVAQFWIGYSATFYINIGFYPMFLSNLYYIDAMTRSDYRLKMTPADYVSGAVNLSVEFLYTVRDFIKKSRVIMSTTSDLPTACNTLQTPSENVTTVENTLHTEEETQNSPSCDDGAELLNNNSFEDKATRLGFIQKVLVLKLLQLLAATVVMTPTYFLIFYMFVNYYIQPGNLAAVSTIAYVVIFGLLICCDQARYQNPYKCVFLVAYPISLAFLVSVVSTIWHSLGPIFMAWVYYCMAVFALLAYSIFALHTKIEFVTLHGIFLGAAVHVAMYAITVPLTTISGFYILYASLVFFLEYVYVLYDLEAMMSKNYSTIITPADFFNATINLHIDYCYVIVNLIAPKVRNAIGNCIFRRLTF